MDFSSIFSEANWTIEGPDPAKPEHRKLIHQVEGEIYRAYFKPATKNAGPICANEYLTSKLAQHLGIPCAKVQLYKLVEGDTSKDGYISHWIDMSNPWSEDVSKDRLEDTTAFSRLFCFDSWVHHLDRSAQNLVYTGNAERYTVHLIDNESALYGNSDNQPAYSVDNFDCGESIRLPNAKSLVTRDELCGFATTIQGLTDDDIVNIVNEFRAGAPDFLSEEHAEHIINKLKRRKELLLQQICDWYDRQP